jgi:hypothetical protein
LSTVWPFFGRDPKVETNSFRHSTAQLARRAQKLPFSTGNTERDFGMAFSAVNPARLSRQLSRCDQLMAKFFGKPSRNSPQIRSKPLLIRHAEAAIASDQPAP